MRKKPIKSMVCEYSHQTGLISAKDVEWMVGDQKACCASTAVCIARDPKYCAENRCQNDGEWDEIRTVYFSPELSEAKQLKDSLAENRWKTLSCSEGKHDASSSGYFVCVLSQGCECD